MIALAPWLSTSTNGRQPDPDLTLTTGFGTVGALSRLQTVYPVSRLHDEASAAAEIKVLQRSR
jgi:hypothetical protein